MMAESAGSRDQHLTRHLGEPPAPDEVDCDVREPETGQRGASVGVSRRRSPCRRRPDVSSLAEEHLDRALNALTRFSTLLAETLS